MSSRPRYRDRVRAAQLITDEYFPVAPRTLLEWDDIEIVILNGKACAPETAWRRAAEKRLQAMLAHQGADDQAPLKAAARATAARMARRRGRAGLPPAT
jgi:hypothetical protein